MKLRILPVIALLSVFALFHSAPAPAGNDKGNGGNIVLCKDAAGNVQSAELLDFYEAMTMREIRRDLGPAHLGLIEKVEIALNRLSRFSPTRANRYREQARSFLSEARFLRGVQLGDIGDSDHILVPAGCDIEQAVNQREPEFPEDKRYIINQDLWNLLDDENRAGLILHELIYRELGHPTSVKSRYFNSYITSNRLDSLSLVQFIELLRRVGLGSVDIQGVLVDLGKTFEFHANEKLKFAHPIPHSSFSLDGQPLELCEAGTRSTEPVIRFFENGRIQEICFENRFLAALPIGSLMFRAYIDSPLLFHDNGLPREGILHLNDPFHVKSSTFDLYVGIPSAGGGTTSDTRVQLHSNGSFEYLEYARGKILAQSHLVEIQECLRRNAGVTLHPSGTLRSGCLMNQAHFTIQTKVVAFSGEVRFDDRAALLQGTLQSEAEGFRVQGSTVRFKAGEEMHFYPDGRVRCGVLARSTVLLSRETGKRRSYMEGTSVCFNENEEVDSTARPRHGLGGS